MTMAEYKNVEPLKNQIADFKHASESIKNNEHLTGCILGLDAIERAIEKLPAVDAVKVVRCKNCKNGTKTTAGSYYCCVFNISVFKPDDYCSSGEARGS